MTDDPDQPLDLPAVLNEIIRGANSVSRLDTAEKQRLLELAAYTVREMRRRAALEDPEADRGDPAFRWRVMSITIAVTKDEDVTAELLKAAELIRSLKIVVDAQDEVLGEDRPEREGD